jgi:hypothetical protein
MCLDCGFYNGKIVLDMKAKKAARTARMEARREAMRTMGEAQATPEEQK